ncbi:MAG: riboflavin synthase [Planctomycetota bacterium]
MFTGIIRQVGTVLAIRRQAELRALIIETGLPDGELSVGDSVNVDGVCLTATAVGEGRAEFEVGAESLRLTTLGGLSQGSRVNIEPALRVGDPLGGHFVSGHVDGVGTIRAKRRLPGEVRLEVEVERRLSDQMIMKGSVAVDGISLTVASLAPGRFEVSLISHTLAATTLEQKGAGQEVNVECDMVGRWVKRLMATQGETLTVEDLKEQGF